MSVLRGEEPRHRSGVAAQARHVRLPHGISRNCPTKSSSLLCRPLVGKALCSAEETRL